eukprot:6188545-Pleurochrysis_carterae.AAC.1
MTAADQSRVCTRAATWSLRRVSSCSSDDRRERNGAQRGVSVEEPREALPDEELLSLAGFFRPYSRERQALAGAEAKSREASTESSEAPSPRKRCSACSWHSAIARREALAAVSCSVVHRCCRSCRKVNRRTRSSDDPKAAAKVRSENHRTGAQGRLP